MEGWGWGGYTGTCPLPALLSSLSLCPSLSLSPSVCLSLSIYLSFFLSFYLSPSLPLSVSVFLSLSPCHSLSLTSLGLFFLVSPTLCLPLHIISKQLGGGVHSLPNRLADLPLVLAEVGDTLGHLLGPT